SIADAGRRAGGSQVSPASTTLLPQVGEQSPSMLALQPGAQQPSPLVHTMIGVCWQAAVQLLALPPKVSTVQGLPSLQAVMSCGHEAGGSQVSPDSSTLLPQVGEQSGSVLALHDDGQQPSRGPQ